MKISKDEVDKYREHQTYLLAKRQQMQSHYEILEKGLLNPDSSANNPEYVDPLLAVLATKKAQIDLLMVASKKMGDAIAEHTHPLAKKVRG